MEAFSTAAFLQRPSSPSEGLQSFWDALLPRLFPATQRVLVSGLRYWQCKDCLELYRFGCCSRIVGAGIGRIFHRWRLGGVATARLRCWGLRGSHWIRKTTGGAWFWCSLLRKRFPPLHSAGDIETRHQQLRLLCLDNNRFGSGNKRVLGPSGLVWSLNSSCP